MVMPIQTSFYSTRDRVARLRALALACGLVATTGHGAHTMGSLSRVLAVLADGYAARPDAVRQFITALAALEHTSPADRDERDDWPEDPGIAEDRRRKRAVSEDELPL
jgi:hypothetical protein